MARYLLDSDAVIDYLRGVARSVSLVDSLYQRREALCTCDVVVAEVYSGVRPADHHIAQDILASFEYLPTSAEVARRAGEWRYDYARRGVTLTTTDTLIAATAHSHQAAVVTANRGDYPMPDVSILPLPR